MRALIGVELLRRLPAGPVDIRDTKLTGFVLRVRPSGTHTYYATWTPKGSAAAPAEAPRRASARWYVLGTPAVLSAPEARDEARKVLADVARGDDPIAAKQAEDRRITFATFVADHYTPWLTAQRTRGAEQAARLRRVFGPTLDALRLDEITGFAIERWRSARLNAGTAPATVNRDLAVVKAALARAVEWGLLTAHPLTKVRLAKLDRGGDRALPLAGRRDAAAGRAHRQRHHAARGARAARMRGAANGATRSGRSTAAIRTTSRRSCCSRSIPGCAAASCSTCGGLTWI